MWGQKKTERDSQESDDLRLRGAGASSSPWVAEAAPSTTTFRRLTPLTAARAAGAVVDAAQGWHRIRGSLGFPDGGCVCDRVWRTSGN